MDFLEGNTSHKDRSVAIWRGPQAHTIRHVDDTTCTTGLPRTYGGCESLRQSMYGKQGNWHSP